MKNKEIETPILGYLKYTGKAVKDGIMDTRRSAEALMGLDEVLRYFISQENPELKDVDYDIPVKIDEGSWIVLLPAVVTAWVVKDYLSAIAKTAGTVGFIETGPAKDITKIVRGSIKAIQWVIKMSSHVGTLNKKEFANAKVKQSIFGETIIEIPNEKGEILSVPKKYFDIYTKCPEKLFSKNASIISSERTLEIGVFEQGKEEKVVITDKERGIFYTDDDEELSREEILFPELVDGQKVELVGEITRATESTNTIGFSYNGHVLTCKPANGSIAAFKKKVISRIENHFFPMVKIVGTIKRTNENHLFEEKRPQIIFTDIVPMEKTPNNQSLFDK